MSGKSGYWIAVRPYTIDKAGLIYVSIISKDFYFEILTILNFWFISFILFIDLQVKTVEEKWRLLPVCARILDFISDVG